MKSGKEWNLFQKKRKENDLKQEWDDKRWKVEIKDESISG